MNMTLVDGPKKKSFLTKIGPGALTLICDHFRYSLPHMMPKKLRANINFAFNEKSTHKYLVEDFVSLF